MSRIRLLFAPENVGFADRLRAALATEGYEATVEDGPAAAALVIWSPTASASPSILAAARAALARRVLVPVALGKAPPPPSFEHLWPMDLAGWTGRDDDPRWRFVLDEIELAVRRGVEIAPAVAPVPAPAQADLKPEARTASPRIAVRPAVPAGRAPAPAPAPLEDVFAEPATYGAARRTAPRLPRAALAVAAGVVVAAGVSAGAFYFGRSASVDSAAGPTPEGRPVVAFVTPKNRPADDLQPTDDAPAAPTAEEAPDPAAPDSRDASTIATTPASAESPLRDAATVIPSAPGAPPSPRVKPATIGALAETAASATPPSEEEADRIAELAWEATRADAAQSASVGRYLRDCLDCPDLAEVDAGSFMMGSPESEAGRAATDLPAAPFAVRKRLAVAVHETTFDEWRACVDDGVCAPRPDNGWGRGDRPVINVSWSDAVAYTQWLSAKTGRRYRLPTEAEWEYAARAGSASPFAFGDSPAADKANYGALRGRTTPTGSYAPNAFGLYDMHGNVAEWTAECWTPMLAGEPAEATPVGGLCSARVIKGGAWNDGGADLRAAHRDGDAESARTNDIGFRVVRDLD